MKVDNVIIFLFVLIFMSCINKQPDDELSMTRTSYSGDKIRFDGYYYSYFPKYKTYGYKVLYRNGVILNFDSSISYENVFDKKKELDKIKSNKSNWGVFQVTNDTVNIQSWNLSEDYSRYILNNFYLKIKVDTTLSYINVSGDTIYFKFVKQNFRPDSTNVFIK